MQKEIKKLSDIDFSSFKYRKEKMEKIYRYSNFYDFYYRSNIYIHSIRIFYMIKNSKEDIINIFPKIDINKLLIMSLIHDDAEIIIWDFQAWDKEKLSKKQLEDLKNIEEKSIEKLSKKFPKYINWYIYKELLLEILMYSSIEAQIVKFFDHIDALCEAIHEYYAWNKCVVTLYENKYWVWILPFDYYINRFKKADSIYNLLWDLFSKKYKKFSPFECSFQRIDFEKQIKNYKPHTLESLNKKFDYPLYEYWKNIMLNSKNKQVIDNLIEFSEKRFY